LEKGKAALVKKGGPAMAANFRIAVHRDDASLHLKLLGTFDGSFAEELIQTLNRNRLGVTRIFIHTSSLSEIHPFGRAVFRSRFSEIGDRTIAFLFTGENASELAPERNAMVRIMP
jgi:hypothetical protein